MVEVVDFVDLCEAVGDQEALAHGVVLGSVAQVFLHLHVGIILFHLLNVYKILIQNAFLKVIDFPQVSLSLECILVNTELFVADFLLNR